MAHFWVRAPDIGWTAFDIAGDVATLLAEPPFVLPGWFSGGEGAPHVWLVHARRPSDAWMVITDAATGVRINGVDITAGIHALAERDEIESTHIGTVFFATDVPARVEPFPGAPQPAFCPRCRQPIGEGTPAVRCPAATCRVWHHETAELNCWTYAERCALCAQPTDLGAGYSWTPED